VRSKVDHYIYSKKEVGNFIHVSLYVDNMLLVKNNTDAIKEVKMQLSSKFEMKDLGAKKFITEMEMKRGWEVRKLCLNPRSLLKQ
jgi:hypothetical protein